MAISTTVQAALQRYREEIQVALREAVARATASTGAESSPLLQDYYGQMRYHLGWVDAQFRPISSQTGKLLRPTLLLLSFEVAGAWGELPREDEPRHYLKRALPAAAAIELTHNFTLIHDDIEDEDSERHHRPTVWKLWGVPQAINAGDGLFALSRLALWNVLEVGVDPALAARLAALLDRTCLTIAEGQYLDMLFETRMDVSIDAYIEMIRRKTAALMACAAEMGALLGTQDLEAVQRLRHFGEAIGLAFQVRDDLLGVWASLDELGKNPAGDIYRRKKSLPILHALAHAQPEDRARLQAIYQQSAAPSQEEVAEVLAIFARTETRSYCQAFLAEQCRRARAALEAVPAPATPLAERARSDLAAFIAFIEEASQR
ncbi:polyprenyl synthetase family protein [Thermogemmatispora sp.]|uniref:polyprenyl synthetase family protein n=1 Tax=Thermogemmatispora sp. TaxID=1968838 RepID=UPI001D410045|nr:polyprenyl synthetase family protein [Thermogemmatispora sp.]MBX5450285.1 polyprenyl synthetase family protein [Thermogemmatispora sp.]